MRKIKVTPPTDVKQRKMWDENRNWQRTSGRRMNEHEIIPEHIQHWRPHLLITFRREGITATERLLKEFENQFLEYVKFGNMTKQEAKGAIENLNSFVNAMKALKKKKQYARLKVLKEKTKK